MMSEIVKPYWVCITMSYVLLLSKDMFTVFMVLGRRPICIHNWMFPFLRYVFYNLLFEWGICTLRKEIGTSNNSTYTYTCTTYTCTTYTMVWLSMGFSALVDYFQIFTHRIKLEIWKISCQTLCL